MLFDSHDIYGKQIEIKTPTKDAMIVALENSEESAARKELAKEILAWYSAEAAKPPLTGRTELDKAAQVMMIEFHADLLWGGSHLLEKRSVTGIETLVIVNQEGEPINSYRA